MLHPIRIATAMSRAARSGMGISRNRVGATASDLVSFGAVSRRERIHDPCRRECIGRLRPLELSETGWVDLNARHGGSGSVDPDGANRVINQGQSSAGHLDAG